MITEKDGNLLNDDAECLVNPVNTVGVMGAGLAKKMANTFPNLVKPYVEACRSKELDIGKVWFWQLHGRDSVWIANLATKQHFNQLSQIEFIQEGLVSLIDGLEKRGIKSVAIPALGCGLGGLPWAHVRDEIRMAFGKHNHIDVRIYRPR